MKRPKLYTEYIAFLATPDQKKALMKEAKREKCDKSDILRKYLEMLKAIQKERKL